MMESAVRGKNFQPSRRRRNHKRETDALAPGDRKISGLTWLSVYITSLPGTPGSTPDSGTKTTPWSWRGSLHLSELRWYKRMLSCVVFQLCEVQPQYLWV